jgi:protein-S-isoprenylcysteine O-methyltransferase Ste14
MTKSYRAAVPPPLIFFGALVDGILVQLLLPLNIFANPGLGDRLGIITIVASAALLAWAVRTMRLVGETPDPSTPVKSIVTVGPFAYSRNPIYLGFTLFDLGLSLLLNNLWLLLFLVVGLLYVNFKIVRGEEAYLEAQFGETYLEYTQKVRRWF